MLAPLLIALAVTATVSTVVTLNGLEHCQTYAGRAVFSYEYPSQQGDRTFAHVHFHAHLGLLAIPPLRVEEGVETEISVPGSHELHVVVIDAAGKELPPFPRADHSTRPICT